MIVSVLLFVGLVGLFTWVYVMNQETKRPIEIDKTSSCHQCSNHSCSHYKEE